MGASGDHAEEGFLALKAIVPLISRLPGEVAGGVDADRLETMLRNALGCPVPVVPDTAASPVSAEPGGADNPGAEYAIRFVALLVRKGYFGHLGTGFQAIEQRIDAKNGVCTVHAESAQPIDGDLEEKIKAELIKKTGVREIKLVSRLVPELLGGYRLRIGTELVDTSLKGQLERMARETHAGTFSLNVGANGGFRW